MPVQPCTKDGKSGFKYGDSGTCYTGDNAKKRAKRQGRAIEANKNTSRSGVYAGVGQKLVRNRNKKKKMLKDTGK